MGHRLFWLSTFHVSLYTVVGSPSSSGRTPAFRAANAGSIPAGDMRFSAPCITIALIVVALGRLVCAQDTVQPPSETQTILVRLVDAETGQAISDADVKVFSDNGIRCAQAPCPTNGQEWHGGSDAYGVVHVPSAMANVETSVVATGYRSGRDLISDSERMGDREFVLELDPDDKIDQMERRLKVVDGATRQPLSNVVVWITDAADCRPPRCSSQCFVGTTNDRGNLYYPIPLGRLVGQCGWIAVDGYESTRFPSGWVKYRVALDKEQRTAPPQPVSDGSTPSQDRRQRESVPAVPR